MEHQFYDQGWNDRVAAKPLPIERTRSYQDGWRDCDGVPESQRTPMGDLSEKSALTEAQIKHMVDRFLGWRLPEDFHPDGGISFKPTFNDHLSTPMKHEPTGTNLFDATQADAMVRYMLDGLPSN